MSTLKCPKCGGKLLTSREVFGLVKFDQSAEGRLSVNNKSLLPVRPLVCDDCQYVEFKMVKTKKA